MPEKRIPPESPKAKRAYAEYESLGPDRSYVKTAAKLGKKAGYARTIEQWASWYHWQDRLGAYETRLLEARRKRRQTDLEKMDEQHALYGSTQLAQAVNYLNTHFSASDERITLRDAIQLMKVAADLERLARGASTSRIEGDMTVTSLPKAYINIDPDEEGSEP